MFKLHISVIDPKTHEREFGNLLAIQDNYPKIVVTMDEVEGVSYQGIEPGARS